MRLSFSPACKSMLSRRFTGALCAIAFLAANPAKADEAAETFVQGVLEQATPVFNATTREEIYSGVADLVDDYVDMRRIGRFVLGQYARRMSDAQAETYYPLFKRYATNIYQKNLANYAGQTLVVTGSVDRSERDIIVNSKIADPAPGDAFANMLIHWRVYRSREGEMTVVDAGADNVWLAIEQRSQFTSIIANNGGGEAGIDALIAELQSQLDG